MNTTNHQRHQARCDEQDIETLFFLSIGHTSADISRRANTTPVAVERRISNIRSKLGATTTIGAVVEAVRSNLI